MPSLYGYPQPLRSTASPGGQLLPTSVSSAVGLWAQEPALGTSTNRALSGLETPRGSMSCAWEPADKYQEGNCHRDINEGHSPLQGRGDKRGSRERLCSGG